MLQKLHRKVSVKNHWIFEMQTIQTHIFQKNQLERNVFVTNLWKFLSKLSPFEGTNTDPVTFDNFRKFKMEFLVDWKVLRVTPEINDILNVSYTIPYIFFRAAFFFWVECVTQAGSLLKYLLMVDLEGAGCCPATSWITFNKLKHVNTVFFQK